MVKFSIALARVQVKRIRQFGHFWVNFDQMVILVDMSKVIEAFAKRLNELRKYHKLSLRKLAGEIGVSDNAIRRWELQLRIPNIEVLVLLANYFGVTTDYLVGLED